MRSPSTLTRFNRWRVRNWVSCFLALGDEANMSPSSKIPIRSFDFEMEGGARVHGNKMSRRKGSCRKEGLLNHQGGESGFSVLMERKDSDSSWPHFQDEDYIVFCFKEDGAFDVVKDVKPEALQRLDSANKTPRPVNRKLNYGEVEETTSDSSYEKLSNDSEVSEELESKKSEVEPPYGVRTRKYKTEDDEYDRKMSTKSTDSNRSDGSRGSFSFPILQWELIGSPVHMPQSDSEAMQARRNKISYARFQCCRF